MARFAGDKSGAIFEPMSLRSGGSAGNYSAAASAVDVSNGFSAMRDKAPRYDQLRAEAMKNAAEIEIAGIKGLEQVTSSGISALGQATGYKLNAQGQIEAAKEAASAAKSSSMFGALGGVLSTGLKLIPGIGTAAGLGIDAATGIGKAAAGGF